MIKGVVVPHVVSSTQPSAQSHTTLSVLIDSVLGSCTPTAVREPTKLVARIQVAVIGEGRQFQEVGVKGDKVRDISQDPGVRIEFTLQKM